MNIKSESHKRNERGPIPLRARIQKSFVSEMLCFYRLWFLENERGPIYLRAWAPKSFVVVLFSIVFPRKKENLRDRASKSFVVVCSFFFVSILLKTLSHFKPRASKSFVVVTVTYFVPPDNPVVPWFRNSSEDIFFLFNLSFRFLIVAASLGFLFPERSDGSIIIPITTITRRCYLINLCGNYSGVADPVWMHHLGRLSDLNTISFGNTSNILWGPMIP